MKAKPSFWIDANTWYCPNHLPGTRIPAGVDSCWYNNCRSERPALSLRPEPPKPKAQPPKTKLSFVAKPDLGTEVCAWHECGKPSSEKSKYCSRNCSNKNARARYKARKVA